MNQLLQAIPYAPGPQPQSTNIQWGVLWSDTVDGSEIRQNQESQVVLPHYLPGS